VLYNLGHLMPLADWCCSGCPIFATLGMKSSVVKYLKPASLVLINPGCKVKLVPALKWSFSHHVAFPNNDMENCKQLVSLVPDWLS